jgi:hypothetical protein
MNLRQLHRTLLVSGSVLLTVGVFLFTQQMISRLSHQVTSTSRVLADFLAQASIPATRNSELQRILTDVIENVDFPIVITDTLGTPRAWYLVGVDTDLVPGESIDSLVAGQPIAPVIRERIERVRAQVAAFDRRNPSIEMRHGSGIRIGAVHYGEPRVLRDLRWVPLVSVAGVVLLLGLGLAGLASMRAAEQRTIWVGMAKETAHQLGTPLSSLMGWVELLRARAHEAGAVPVAELEETVREMDRDIDRLDKVAQRFSRVGSAPSLAPQDVRPVVRDVVSYMRRRLPRGTLGITVTERYEEVPPVMLNPELVEWALENLISNAVTALEHKAGSIEVAVMRAEGMVEIAVTDSGRGMTPTEQRKAFVPGYTTRRRGWGLGLALARRVVEEYHRGKIFVRRSSPGEGTTMVMRLPEAKDA